MRASRGLVAVDPDGQWPRLLPEDSGFRIAAAEVREAIDRAHVDLERCAAAWASDGPGEDGLRESAEELVATAQRVLDGARELRRLGQGRRA